MALNNNRTFHSNRLDRIPPVENTTAIVALIDEWDRGGRQTGGLGRLYQQRREQNTGAMTALKALEKLAYPVSQPLVDPDATQLVPAIAPPKKYDLLPKCVEYAYADNPLIMLYGACLKSLDQLGRVPDGLYINSLVLPNLQRQTRALTGQEYDGHYRLFYRHAVELIPVGIEKDLPDLLKLATGGMIPRDRVIAVCDC
jgi:hypothetical protein